MLFRSDSKAQLLMSYSSSHHSRFGGLRVLFGLPDVAQCDLTKISSFDAEGKARR